MPLLRTPTKRAITRRAGSTRRGRKTGAIRSWWRNDAGRGRECAARNSGAFPGPRDAGGTRAALYEKGKKRNFLALFAFFTILRRAGAQFHPLVQRWLRPLSRMNPAGSPKAP